MSCKLATKQVNTSLKLQVSGPSKKCVSLFAFLLTSLAKLETSTHTYLMYFKHFLRKSGTHSCALILHKLWRL